MLHLYANDILLDLDPRSRVTLRGSNPAFEPDGVGRVWTQPFRLPANGRNLNALQHTVRLDSADRGAEVPAFLHVDGLPWIVGVLAVNEVTGGSIEVVFRNEPRQWLVEMDKVKINEILPAVSIAQTVVAQWLLDVDTPPNVYSLNINGNLFNFNNLSGTANDSAIQMRDLVNAVFPGVASVSGAQITLLPGGVTPFEVEVPGPTGQGISLNTYFNYASARQQNFLNHHDAQYDTPADSHAWPVLFNSQFYADNQAFSYFVNYRHGAFIGRCTPQTTEVWEHTYTPFLRVWFILEAIRERLPGVEAWAGVWDDDDFQAMLLYNNLGLDDIAEDFFTDEGGKRFINRHVTGYDLNNHVPKIGAREFWQKIMGFLNLYAAQDGTTIILKKCREQLDVAPLDWTDRLAGTPTVTKQKLRGHRMKFADDNSESRQPYQLLDYTEGDAEWLIETVRPLYETTMDDDNTPGESWNMAMVLARGSSAGPRQETRADYAVRLFFDREKQFDTGGNEYWMSSHVAQDTGGDVIGGWAMEWEPDELPGLYETFWAGWAAMLADGQPVKFSARLYAHEIIQFLRWETPVVLIRHPLGQVRIIVREIEFSSSADDNRYETEVSGIIIP